MEGVQLRLASSCLVHVFSYSEAMSRDVFDFFDVDLIDWVVSLMEHIEEIDEFVFSGLLVRQFFLEVFGLFFLFYFIQLLSHIFCLSSVFLL